MLNVKATRVVLAAAVALGLTSASALAENWKCYTYQSAPASPVNVGLEKLATEINVITSGRVNVKCSVGGALPIAAADIAPAVSDGVIDFASTVFNSGYVPISNLGGFPGLFKSTSDYNEKAWPVLRPSVEKAFAEHNVKVLGIYHYPMQMIFGAKNAPALKSLSDLKGKTVRVSSPEQGALVQNFGAIPVTISTADVATALQRGAVQYVVTAAFSGGRLWQDSLNSALTDPISIASAYVVMNMNRWDSLSAEEQTAVQAAVDNMTASVTSEQEAGNDAALKEFAEVDHWTVVPTSAEVADQITSVMKPIWHEWAEKQGPDAVKLLAELEAALGL